MKSCRILWAVAGIGTLSLWGCSGSDGTSPGVGGKTNAAGGATSLGGTTSAGGAVAVGGISSTGGVAAAGGALSTGGTPNAGGTKAGGGVASTGGSKAAGGVTSTGGAAATGGKQGNGGSAATGGSKAGGGTAATGGSKAGGGTAATGGSKAGGGTSSVGGGSTVNCTSTAGASSTCPEGASSMCGMLAAHNAVRAGVAGASPAIPPLRWDCTLAAFAQAWANTCPAGHNPNRSVEGQTAGENIAFFSTTSLQSPATVVNLWAGEASSYTYANNSCNGTCGHYTQLVWRNTTAVGCGVATGCSGSWSQIWVCDYLPPGNFTGQKPY